MENSKIQSQKIKPCLWFNNNAEEAAKFYTSIFSNSKIGSISHYGKNAPLPEGTVLTVTFQLEGQEFMALNGGPVFQLSEAISFIVDCKNQEEVDNYWNKLLEGEGKEQQCGWLKDRFGLSWQIVPSVLGEMMSDKDPEKSSRVMQAVLKMIKLDIPTLEKAYKG